MTSNTRKKLNFHSADDARRPSTMAGNAPSMFKTGNGREITVDKLTLETSVEKAYSDLADELDQVRIYDEPLATTEPLAAAAAAETGPAEDISGLRMFQNCAHPTVVTTHTAEGASVIPVPETDPKEEAAARRAVGLRKKLKLVPGPAAPRREPLPLLVARHHPCDDLSAATKKAHIRTMKELVKQQSTREVFQSPLPRGKNKRSSLGK